MKTFRAIKSVSLSETRWLGYAIAAGATATGAIATADAEVHYSGPVDYKFQGRSTFTTHTFPLSNGAYLIAGINHVHDVVSYDYAYCAVNGARLSNAVRGPGNVGVFCHVAALPGRSVVSAGDFSIAGARATMQDGACTCPDWQDRGTYYVGFRFNNGAGPQYGWVRIRWSGCPANNFIVKDYAWGDVGDRIRTGQRSSSGDMVDTVNESGSLGLLAVGAAGLVAWRKRRKQATE